MLGSSPRRAPPFPTSLFSRSALVWPAVISAAVLVAYYPSWRIPLLFDDVESVALNTSIRPPWSWSDLLSPPAAVTTKGRPLANLSFAFSYALSGLRPWGYHAVSLTFHLVAAWTLFGLVNRTLARARKLGNQKASAVAGWATLLWAVHPALVQSVSYISQRTEVMMGAFTLLTLYSFVRWIEDRATWWAAVSIGAAMMGTLCKESFVAVPLLIMVYDRSFFAESFRAAWGARHGYYALLGIVWPIALVLLSDVSKRGVGLGQGISVLEYARTQLQAWNIYLGLSVWPFPLIFDRGVALLSSWREALPYLFFPSLLVGGTACALMRRSAVGFLLAAFVLLLLPTSSLVPVSGATIAENRLYLPSAAITVGFALAASVLMRTRVWLSLIGTTVALASVGTMARNATLQDPISLWRQTIARAPNNARAHNNLGELLASDPDSRDEARQSYESALRLKPDYAVAHQNLGILLARQADGLEPGIAHLEEALRLDPSLAAAHSNLGNLLSRSPARAQEAVIHHDAALKLDPRLAAAWYNRGNALAREPAHWQQALSDFERALSLDPTLVEAHLNRGALLAKMNGRENEAAAEFTAALRLRPNDAELHLTLGDLLATQTGSRDAAGSHYEEALRLNPDSVAAHFGLGNLAAASTGRVAEARSHFEAALRLNPSQFEVHTNLAALLEREPSTVVEALSHHRRAVELAPNNAIVHYNLAACLDRVGAAKTEARNHYQRALELNPALEPARLALQRLGK